VSQTDALPLGQRSIETCMIANFLLFNLLFFVST